MLRENLEKVKPQSKDRIQWRSHEPARIETFSDAVFAFAISLLIISLSEIPKGKFQKINSKFQEPRAI